MGAPTFMPWVQPCTIISGAPLAKATHPEGERCSVVMRLASELNGISCTRGNSVSRSIFFKPALAANTTNAPSVGSPLICQRPPARDSCASDVSAAAVNRSFKGADGGTAGNYANDHPIGPNAKLSLLGGNSVGRYVDLDSTTAPTKLILKASQPDNKYTTFQSNYGLPTVVGSRTGAGFAVETGMTTAGDAYVVCTTCHTPHSMYTASASSTNPIGGNTSGTFPSYFFLAAPYNPGADTANGTKASSATQFCRQCHFTGAGGSNEGSNILNVSTAF